MAEKVLVDHLCEPLNDARAAKIDIHAGDGNLTIDRLTAGEPVLASGELQYFEKQGKPTRSMISNNGQTIFTMKGGRSERPWFHFPWAACSGATNWQIQLNPEVPVEIKAHSDGGNVRLDLTGMSVTSVLADIGGGNVDVFLPEVAADLNVAAKTGAGNVTVEIGCDITGSSLINASSGAGNVVVCIPSGVAACIHATLGLGKAIVDPLFLQLDPHTYQSPDFEAALNKVEIWAKSGAGNVIVNIKPEFGQRQLPNL
jgi:hypothetical protein